MKKYELTTPVRRTRGGVAGGSSGPGAGREVRPAYVSESRLPKLQAIKFIGEKDRRANDDQRSSDNRARSLIDSAVKRGDVEFGPDGKIAFADLVAWARKKKKLCVAFANLPATKTSAALEAHAVSGSRATAELSPGTLEECRIALGEANVRIRELEARLVTLASEVARLRPLELKAKERSEKASRAGSTPRRPR